MNKLFLETGLNPNSLRENGGFQNLMKQLLRWTAVAELLSSRYFTLSSSASPARADKYF